MLLSSSAVTLGFCLVTSATIVSSLSFKTASLSFATVESASIAYPSFSGVISKAPFTLFIVASTGASGFFLLAFFKNDLTASSLNSMSGVIFSGFSSNSELFANLSSIFPVVNFSASDNINSLLDIFAPSSAKLLSSFSPFTSKTNFFASAFSCNELSALLNASNVDMFSPSPSIVKPFGSLFSACIPALPDSSLFSSLAVVSGAAVVSSFDASLLVAFLSADLSSVFDSDFFDSSLFAFSAFV